MPDRGKLDAPACVAVAPTLGCLASAGARLRPVFDGHHDALTKWPSEALRRGNRDGHFDLTRARDAALVASIWAIFTPTPGETLEFTQQGDSYDVPLAGEIGQREAAPLASSAACSPSNGTVSCESRAAWRILTTRWPPESTPP
jgi:hypothetical protein